MSNYAEPVTKKGFVFMDTPGYDPVAATGQVAGGANHPRFTTGRGSAYGCKPTPSVKLATNTPMYLKHDRRHGHQLRRCPRRRDAGGEGQGDLRASAARLASARNPASEFVQVGACWAMATCDIMRNSCPGRSARRFWPLLKVVNIAGALSLLLNIAPAFGLALIAPVMTVIVAFHFAINPPGVPVAIILIVLGGLLVWAYRDRYKALLN
jgi:hypothetical protein